MAMNASRANGVMSITCSEVQNSGLIVLILAMAPDSCCGRKACLVRPDGSIKPEAG